MVIRDNGHYQGENGHYVVGQTWPYVKIINVSTCYEREILVEFRFIEKSAKNLENFNLDEGILKLLRYKIVIFPEINFRG